MKKILLAFLSVLILLAGILVGNAFRFPSRQLAGIDAVAVKTRSGAADRLAGAIRFPSISAYGWVDTAALLGLHAYLDSTFPGVAATLEKEPVNGLSLLYHWQGRQPDLKPVVPPDTATLAQWQYPPFAGRVDENFIYGRGSMDDKSSVVAILEAIDMLIAAGYRPARSLYLAFGHDEETGGTDGAVQLAARLQALGVEAEFVLDEGGFVMPGTVPGVEKPVALVGIAEKGGVNLRLTCAGEGGHSSMPPHQTAVGILSAAIARLEAHPFPPRMGGTISTLFDYAGPEMKPGLRLVFANRWLFGPLIRSILEKKQTTRASIRTTTAVTVIRGGVKANVLPTEATAIANFRIIPGETADDVLAYVRRTIADDRVQVEIHDLVGNPSTVSDPESAGFRHIQQAAHETLGDSVVVPYLVIANTDARHYEGISAQIFRFLPLHIPPEDLPRMHGMDERITVVGHEQAIHFYHQLIQHATRESL